MNKRESLKLLDKTITAECFNQVRPITGKVVGHTREQQIVIIERASRRYMVCDLNSIQIKGEK